MNIDLPEIHLRGFFKHFLHHSFLSKIISFWHTGFSQTGLPQIGLTQIGRAQVFLQWSLLLFFLRFSSWHHFGEYSDELPKRLFWIPDNYKLNIFYHAMLVLLFALLHPGIPNVNKMLKFPILYQHGTLLWNPYYGSPIRNCWSVSFGKCWESMVSYFTRHGLWDHPSIIPSNMPIVQ